MTVINELWTEAQGLRAKYWARRFNAMRLRRYPGLAIII